MGRDESDDSPGPLGAGAAAPSGARRGLALLVVDDEARFLESLRLALADHDVEARSSGREALALLEEDPTRFDAVICDLAMPEIDGVAFYERMLAFGIVDRFILMTGGAYTPRTAEFLARKTCRSVAKPFLLEPLLELLDGIRRAPTT
jgi:DNA-binding NtrC family response regulator